MTDINSISIFLQLFNTGSGYILLQSGSRPLHEPVFQEWLKHAGNEMIYLSMCSGKGKESVTEPAGQTC